MSPYRSATADRSNAQGRRRIELPALAHLRLFTVAVSNPAQIADACHRIKFHPLGRTPERFAIDPVAFPRQHKMMEIKR
jgi:hypothetical protein